jgi:hypothetical protein
MLSSARSMLLPLDWAGEGPLGVPFTGTAEGILEVWRRFEGGEKLGLYQTGAVSV